MLEREFKYFKDHQNELVAKYNGRYIAIVGETVVGDFATELEAYTETKKSHELGTFLIQLCAAGKEPFTQSFHSRVSFDPHPSSRH